MCLAVFFIVCHAGDARAEVRKYVDQKGNVHLTDKEGGPEDAIAPGGPSSTTMYQYLDERGRVHLTNDKGSILPQYLDSLKETKGIERRSESLSVKFEDAFSGNREDTWLKYKQLGWFEKNALIARAGFADMKGVLEDLKVQLLFVTILFIGLGVFAIIRLRKASHMMSVIVLLLSCYGMVYLAMHIKSSMGRGSDILSNLKQMQSLSKGQAALTGGDKAVSSSKGGQGGIVGSLRQLQSMSAERQDLFRMILEED